MEPRTQMLPSLEEAAAIQHGLGATKKGACDLSAPNMEALQDQPKRELTEQEQADQLGISLGRFQAAKAYARQLHVNDKRMKTSTIRAKVCKKFNIKLV